MISDVISLKGWKTETHSETSVRELASQTFKASLRTYLSSLFFLLLFGSNHGQPSSDQPSVTDPWRNISLQHPVG